MKRPHCVWVAPEWRPLPPGIAPEAEQPDHAFLTQPVGAGAAVDYSWAQTLDQARHTP